MKQHSPWQRQILLFLVSQCITLFGSTLVQMAVIWYVTMQTASGAWVAAFSVCAYLPQFVISFWGGVWADRYDRKTLIIAADAAIALVTLAMVWALPHLSSEPLLLGGLLLMSLLRSLGAGIQTPAVSAVIPQLVPEAQLMRYNGLNACMQSLVQFAAPAAAGLLFAAASLRSALLVDVLTAAVGISLFLLVPLPAHPLPREQRSVLADMRQGLAYAFTQRFVGRLLLIYGLFVFLSVPAGFLAGLLVRRVYGETYWYLTIVEVIGFAGMAAGGLLMSLWGERTSRNRTLALALAVYGALAALMGLTPPFPLYLALMLGYGIALTTVQTALTTLLQEAAAPALHGRIFGLLSAMYAGFLPLGMAVFGPLADYLPLSSLMIASGAALAAAAALVGRASR